MLPDVIQEASELRLGGGEVAIRGACYLLFFVGSHEPPGIAVLAALAHRGHADLDAEPLQARDSGGRGVLPALVVVGVMDARPLPAQRRGPAPGRAA